MNPGKVYSLPMGPVLFSIDGLVVTTYSALLDLGLIVAAALTLIRARAAALPRAAAFDVALAATVGGVIGARLGYVMIHWDYFAAHLDEAWRIWAGGLTWQAGVIGGAVGAGGIARLRFGQSPLTWLDLLAPGVALGTVFGWLACFGAACAAGREVFPGEGLFALAMDLPDSYGSWAPRLPAQLFGAGWGLVVFSVVWRLGRRAPRPGVQSACCLTLSSAGSVLIGFSLTEVTTSIGGLSAGQWLDLLLIGIGAAGWLAASL